MADTSLTSRNSSLAAVIALVAILALSLGAFLLGGRGGTKRPSADSPGIAYASVSMDCGGKTYTISTGNGAGNCVSNIAADGSTSSMGCSDGTNSAQATCTGGKGVCTSASGSGSCTIPK